MLAAAAYFGAGLVVGLILAGAVLIAVAVRGLSDAPSSPPDVFD